MAASLGIESQCKESDCRENGGERSEKGHVVSF